MKISLAIPTRSRAKYLRAALQSVLIAVELAGCEVEIVVSDNASDDDTAEVVTSFNSSAIRYLRQPVRVSMRQNFEAALNACTGSHIVFIGDDDGVVPHGFLRLREMIEAGNHDIFKWRVLNYHWPDPTRGRSGHIELRTNRLGGLVREADPRAIFDKFLKAQFDRYQQGGMIYHGCISRRLIDRVRAASGGTYFWTSCPDVHASIINLLMTDRSILSADIPVTLGGTSPRSNGAAGQEYSRTAQAAKDSEFTRFVTELEGDPYLGKMPPTCPSINLVTLDSILLALDFARLASVPDRDAWLCRIREEVISMPQAIRTDVEIMSRNLLGPEIHLALPSLTNDSSNLDPIISRQDPAVTVRGMMVRLSTFPWLSNVAVAASMIDRITGNKTRFVDLPRNWPRAAWRVWNVRRRAIALGADNYAAPSSRDSGTA